jgi:membrane dipeptidase
MTFKVKLPIFDTHCDLLSYLALIPDAKADKVEDIGCAIPFLIKGNVKIQILAIYTSGSNNSMEIAQLQALKFQELLKDFPEELCYADLDFLSHLEAQKKIGVVTAIENASSLANEVVPIHMAYEQLEKLIGKVGRIAYISLTHHGENRFGGGNYTDGVGLKKDGKTILDYISGRKIAIDLSHTSDLLAKGILDHIDSAKLDIPVVASHSNFRDVWNHKRNLPRELVQEIIRRGGIIGINFMREFLDRENPDRFIEHILHGIESGGENNLCFGADYFYTHNFPDKNRIPLYFPSHEDASQYPSILQRLSSYLSPEQHEKLAYQNAQRFFVHLWKEKNL